MGIASPARRFWILAELTRRHSIPTRPGARSTRSQSTISVRVWPRFLDFDMSMKMDLPARRDPHHQQTETISVTSPKGTGAFLVAFMHGPEQGSMKMQCLVLRLHPASLWRIAFGSRLPVGSSPTLN